MKKSFTKKDEQHFLMVLNKLSIPARMETLDFMGYLLAKSETEYDATAEILADTDLMAGINAGLQDYAKGEVSRFEI